MEPPVLGADKCIYFPPFGYCRVLKLNPRTQNISLVGESYSRGHRNKWLGGVLALNGFIYFAPYNTNFILKVDTRPVNEQVPEAVQKIMGDEMQEHMKKKSKLR